jgi:ketosteroid isomerase-like protein
MSSENVEIVRRMNDAFRAGDWETSLEAYDEEAELDASRIPGGGVHRGPEGVRRFFASWMSPWERFEVDRLDLIEAGDAVVMLSQITGVGRDSGVEVTMRAADVFYLEDGKIVRHIGYPDADEALADLGLSG